VRVQKNKVKVVVRQGKDSLQKALEQLFIMLAAKDELEQKIIFYKIRYT
jgi:hypothetical protein